jgi:hypothetical protein
VLKQGGFIIGSEPIFLKKKATRKERMNRHMGQSMELR